jgi:cytochrome c-type biogenesis protein CcmH
VTRRDWLSRAALLGLAGLVAVPRRGLAAQQPARPDSAAGDPLYRPDAVQERAIATATDNDPIVAAVEHRLKCTCGCNLDIFTCRTTDFTCQFSPALHKDVMSLRAEGKSPDEVITAFVAKHGEQILMAPPPKGFNLAGYLVPGIAILATGAALSAVILRRRVLGQTDGSTDRPNDGPTVRPSGSPTDTDLKRLENALTEVAD